MRISFPRFIGAVLSALVMMVGPASLPASADDTKFIDLSISQTDNPDPVVENGFVTYSAVVSNLGPQPANTIVVNASTSAGKYVSGTGHRWTCVFSNLDKSATCEHTGAIDKGTSADTLSLVVQAPAGTSQIVHTAGVSTLSPDYQDTKPLNNSSSETTNASPGTDVTVDQVDEPDPVTAGNTVRYIISVNNNNNSAAATGVTLNTSASAGSVSKVEGQGWSCTVTGARTASCSRSTPVGLNSPAPAVYLQLLTPFSTSASTLTNSATVSSATADNNQANNTNVESTTVGAGSNGSNAHVTASGYIDPSGGQVTTCAPSGATSTDTTCTTVVFPAGPGGVATLVEGPQLDICSSAGCTGDSVDVIVPDGYNPGTHSAIKVYLYVDGSISNPANDPTREIYMEKPVNGRKTEAVAIPSCAARLPGVPCVSSQQRLADGDYLGIVELFSQDPIFEVGDGLNNIG